MSCKDCKDKRFIKALIPEGSVDIIYPAIDIMQSDDCNKCPVTVMKTMLTMAPEAYTASGFTTCVCCCRVIQKPENYDPTIDYVCSKCIDERLVNQNV